uniref:Uncharacterized protein n=1 Tax=Anguilla anguilla TaxID=7936 RepID=A0A0E9V1W5_ANGAN
MYILQLTYLNTYFILCIFAAPNTSQLSAVPAFVPVYTLKMTVPILFITTQH